MSNKKGPKLVLSFSTLSASPLVPIPVNKPPYIHLFKWKIWPSSLFSASYLFHLFISTQSVNNFQIHPLDFFLFISACVETTITSLLEDSNCFQLQPGLPTAPLANLSTPVQSSPENFECVE